MRTTHARMMRLMRAALSVAIILIGFAFLSFRSFRSVRDRSLRSAEARLALEHDENLLVDAETGQRGFLITADPKYLDVYRSSARDLSAALDAVRALTRDDPGQQARVTELERLQIQKLAELGETISLATSGKRDAALDVVRTDQGKLTMDAARTMIDRMQADEVSHLGARTARASLLSLVSFVFIGLAAVCLLGLAWAQLILSRQLAQREAAAARDEERIAQAQLRRTQSDAERARLEEILTIMPVGVQLIGAASGEVTFTNARARAMFPTAATTIDLETALHSLSIRHLDGAPYTLEEIPVARALYGNETTSGIEMLLRRADGVEIALRVSATPLHDGEGTTTAALVVFDDVTTAKQAEAEHLRVARFQERSVGILSHDLRNPLAAIMMSASALDREGLPERSARNVRRILSSTERIARMVDQLLDYTRSRLGGGIPIERRETDLVEISRRIVDEVSAAHPSQPITIAGPTTLTGEWDGDRLGAVIANLVSNAIQHGRPDGPIEVRLEESGGEVLLEVHNEGDPIPADVRPILFEPFRRGTSGNSRQALGLGLFIANEIVRAHRGTLEVRSSVEEGTTFTARLPRHQAASLAA